MEKFFNVIVIVGGCVLLLISYYFLKTAYQRNKQERAKHNIRIKHYEDEKNYTQNYLRVRLRELESGTISWIQIYSRNFPEQKIEILFDRIKGEISVQNRRSTISLEEMSAIRELGMTDHHKSGDLFCFYTPVNSKIVVDIIYYILETVYRQKSAQNLKFITSGGY